MAPGGLIFDVNVPQLSGFNIEGGGNFSPELTSLLLGLVLYTGAFMAEIIRAGILSVENGIALGMNDQVMTLSVLRINLTKTPLLLWQLGI